MRESNQEKFLRVLEQASGPLCDDCVTMAGGFRRRQIVHQQAEKCFGLGKVDRRHGVACSRCGGLKKSSWLVAEGSEIHPDLMPEPPASVWKPSVFVPAEFEVLAREKISELFCVRLTYGTVGQVPGVFDFASADGQVVGEAKYLGLATDMEQVFALINARVWLMEKTGAKYRFLVFGKDMRAPRLWLDRYGSLLTGTDVYFLSDAGELAQLNGSGGD